MHSGRVSVRKQPLLAAISLKPPALPGDTYSMMKTIAGSLAMLALGVSIATSPTLAARGGHFGGGGVRIASGFGGFHGRFGDRGLRGGFGGGGFYDGFDAYYGGYGYGPYGPYGSCAAYRPVYDQLGRIVTQTPVNDC